MRAMVLDRIKNLAADTRPLKLVEMPIPAPADGEALIRVSTCGVCRTELDEIEGRTPPSQFPMTLGHQVVGYVERLGPKTSLHQIGDRVGVGWIFDSCGHCSYCQTGMQNLCAEFQATGRDAPGGYAEYMTVPERSAYPIPEALSDAEAAPLLCAGAVRYRSLRLSMLEEGQALGLTGFGASAHLVLKTVRHLYKNVRICVFSRSPSEQEFANELGADWAGDFSDPPAEPLNRIIDTTPVWKPVVEALRNLAPGGRLVINAIRKESTDKEYLLNLDYPTHLWLEKEIKSVANVTQHDISEFIKVAASVPIKPDYQIYELEEANRALLELKRGQIRGAKVLQIL
ncbi:MAG: alcohol dehydrogenase [Anaerolineae bacterium UTCFX2]|nr:zinc-dependent alcohol dehydrogenase family protein [Anaerolineae bacterium]OQY90509.1 MAG: alcohol dehydrogenase [Anaerolineae bacterium UTCFX2]